MSLKSLTVLSELLVPQVSDWTSFQAVGAVQADGRYVRQVIGNYGSIVGATIDNTTQRLVFQSSKGPGDYATTTQVNTAQSSANSAQGTGHSEYCARWRERCEQQQAGCQ